jgi:hypothetical protein
LTPAEVYVIVIVRYRLPQGRDIGIDQQVMMPDLLASMSKEELVRLLKPDPKGGTGYVVAWPEGGMAWYPTLETARRRLYNAWRDARTGDPKPIKSKAFDNLLKAGASKELAEKVMAIRKAAGGKGNVKAEPLGGGQWGIIDQDTGKVMSIWDSKGEAEAAIRQYKSGA